MDIDAGVEAGEIGVEIGRYRLQFAVSKTVTGPAAHRRYATIELPTRVSEVVLRLSRPAHLAFLGYEARGSCR